ncbi:hypothetical protein AB4167_22180 [Vibrio sp. 10N.286.49.E11]|uniref:hypothetical protein n=1 Tax=Vibrio sp. 10N.286.49.E11 TaxID=3229703 RepID=UPI0035521A49
MKWYECRSEQDLKMLGTIAEVKKEIAKDLEGKVVLTARSWTSLLDKVSLLQGLFHRPEHDSVWHDGFVSETEKYIFCLTKLDGKNRQKNLGVSGLHYKNKDLAKKWMFKISHKIHSDKCNDPRAKDAMVELESMYKEMNK